MLIFGTHKGKGTAYIYGKKVFIFLSTSCEKFKGKEIKKEEKVVGKRFVKCAKRKKNY